ncbi:TVP38/TMEM64 family protein [Ureibacillus sp. NPDC094379]
MKEVFIELVGQASFTAVFLCLFVSVLISIIGILPSAFVTAANLVVFGLVEGVVVSIVGEALGAVVSFLLYRKGIKKWRAKDFQNSSLQRLSKLEGANAFWAILGLRILPFIPSGAVTLGSAFSKVSLRTFAIASTIGKIPSLLIEAGSIYGFMRVDINHQIAIIFLIVGCMLLWKVIIRD